MKKRDYTIANMKNRALNTKSNYRSGATLAEMLVVVGIVVFIMTSVLSIQVLSRQIYEFSVSSMDVHGKARIAMDWMTKDIRWTNQILTSKTISAQTYTTATDELVLKIPSIDNNGDVILSTYDYVAYHLNNTNPANIILERIIDADVLSSRADDNRTIASNMNTLNLSSGGTGLSGIGDVTALTQIEISLTTGKTASSGRVVNHNLNSAVELRNK